MGLDLLAGLALVFSAGLPGGGRRELAVGLCVGVLVMVPLAVV